VKRRVAVPILVLMGGLLLLSACTRPTAGNEVHFRSEQYHVEANLPPGWAAAEGPTSLAKPFIGFLAFNSWGEDDFWAPEVVTETDQEVYASYSPETVLGQLPAEEAYIVLSHFAGGPQSAQEYGPEHEQQHLSGLWTKTDCREGDADGGATVVPFFKWGRRLRLEVTCAPDVSDVTAAEVNELLDSWRFDEVPAGDFGWASSCPPPCNQTDSRCWQADRARPTHRGRPRSGPRRADTRRERRRPGHRSQGRQWSSPSRTAGTRRWEALCLASAHPTAATGGGLRPGRTATSY